MRRRSDFGIPLLLAVLVFSALWPRYQTHRLHLEVVQKAKLCRENIKKIGTAAQMYQTDYGSTYPSHIDQLSPEYLSPRPACPFDGNRYQAYVVNITEASRIHFPEGLLEISPGCPGLVVNCTSAVHKTFEPDLEPGYGFFGFFQAPSKLVHE